AISLGKAHLYGEYHQKYPEPKHLQITFDIGRDSIPFVWSKPCEFFILLQPGELTLGIIAGMLFYLVHRLSQLFLTKWEGAGFIKFGIAHRLQIFQMAKCIERAYLL